MDTIYIQLLDEGTTCWRPTLGEPLGNGLYRVQPTPNYDVADERWEFVPGSVVRCTAETRDGKSVLIAKEEVQS